MTLEVSQAGRVGCGPAGKGFQLKGGRGWCETLVTPLKVRGQSHYILPVGGQEGPSRRTSYVSGKRQRIPPGVILGAFNKGTEVSRWRVLGPVTAGVP